MGLTIKDPEIERLAEALAQRTGLSVEDALRQALQARLEAATLEPIAQRSDSWQTAAARFRDLVGHDGPLKPVTRDEMDDLWGQ